MSGAEAVYGFTSFIFMLAVFASYVIMLVAIWRAMKAFESMAGSMQQIASGYQREKEPGGH